MAKEYYKIELSLETSKKFTEEQLDNFFQDIIEVVEKYNMTAGGGIKAVDEQGNDLQE
jgi:ABC-type xylose transport system substrate-binding protein